MVDKDYYNIKNSLMDKKFLKKLGNRIKEIRQDRGLSQEALADQVNLSRNYIGMIERAEINVPILTILKIAKALNVELPVLFTFDD